MTREPGWLVAGLTAATLATLPLAVFGVLRLAGVTTRIAAVATVVWAALAAGFLTLIYGGNDV